MVALRKRVTDRLTMAEFLVWDSGDRSGRRWQLRDGMPEAMAPATRGAWCHPVRIGRLIGNHLLAAGDRCRVISEPGIMPRVRAAENVRIPDLAVTCTPPSAERLVAGTGPGDRDSLPSNAEETWENVWAYTTIPSVAEILVISSTAVEAELLRRDADGNWPAGRDSARSRRHAAPRQHRPVAFLSPRPTAPAASTDPRPFFVALARNRQPSPQPSRPSPPSRPPPTMAAPPTTAVPAVTAGPTVTAGLHRHGRPPTSWPASDVMAGLVPAINPSPSPPDLLPSEKLPRFRVVGGRDGSYSPHRGNS